MRKPIARLLLFMCLIAPAHPDAVFAQANNAVVPGTLKLTATFNSIGVELPFVGDDNADTSAALEFRKTGDSAWRAGLPLWRTDDGSTTPGRAFYGSAMLLDPGTNYEIRVTLTDPDGVNGNSVLSSETRTRAEDISDAATLKPTHYVAPDGNDANDGSSPEHAWRSLETVFNAAPPGAIVDVAPGQFVAPHTVRTTPLTIKARNPAAVEQLQVLGGEQRSIAVEASQGGRSIVEPRGSDDGPAVSAPAGAENGDLVGLALNRIAPWQSVTLPGVVDSSQAYTVWKWAGSPVPKATEMSFSTTRDGTPTRITNWNADAPVVDTPQKWAEQVYTNPDWHSGFWASNKDGIHFTDENRQDAMTNLSDLYLRLPGDADPNSLYTTISAYGVNGLAIDGPDVRVSGLEFRTTYYDVELGAHSTRAIVDQNLFDVGLIGLAALGQKGKAGGPSTYGSDHVVESNVFRDSGLTSSDLNADPPVPWGFIKTSPKLGRTSETTAVGGGGGARRMVIRRNTFDGSFDGFGGYHDGFDRYSMQDADIYANLFRNIADDGLDLARGTINNRIWGNRFEQAQDVFSIASPTWGPVYFFRNEGWQFGDQAIGRTADGKGPTGLAVKYGAVDYKNQPPARVYILLNTFWSDETVPSPAEGINRYGSPGKDQPYLVLRDNIVRVTDKAARVEAPTRWDEDANDFSSSNPDQTAIVQTPAGRYRGDVSAYRASSGQGAHTNTRAGFSDTPDAELMDPTNGDLRLRPGSAFIDRGVPVANIADRPDVDFSAAAPDLGAVEFRP